MTSIIKKKRKQDSVGHTAEAALARRERQRRGAASKGVSVAEYKRGIQAYRESRQEARREAERPTFRCEVCGTDFVRHARAENTRTCSTKCHRKLRYVGGGRKKRKAE
jgi:hypothetical protein